MVERVCLICNKKFYTPKSNVKRGYGITCSLDCKYKKIGKDRTGEKNVMWKGDGVTNRALHDWVKYYLKKPSRCVDCHKQANLDLANLSQEYKRDLSDWEWLCRKCHMTKDGRLEIFLSHRKPFPPKIKFTPEK